MKQPKKRDNILKGATVRSLTGCGKVYVTINRDCDNKVYELFAKLGKTGSCTCSQLEALARMITLVFRLDGDPAEIFKHLKGIKCPGDGTSCPEAIAQAIEEYLDETEKKV